jgi:hypothetical protein
MFLMEESAKFGQTAAFVTGLAIASGAEQATFNNIRTLLDSHHETMAYGNWSVEAVKTQKRKALSDRELLDKVNKLGELGRGK